MSERPKTTLASPNLVREFCEMEPAPYDRPLSERRLQVYERILKAGEFRPVTWAAATCGETNCTYRVNGKHTSTLLSKPTPLPDFFVTVERYVCDKLSDVASLYNTFDSKLGSRTTADVNLAFARTIRDLDSVPARLVHLTVTAAAFHKWGDKARDVPPAEKAEELLDSHDFTLWLHSVVGNTSSGSSARHLIRGPVANAMFATYRRAKTPAEEFWTLVKDESHPDRDHQTRVLARYLVRTTVVHTVTAGGRGGKGKTIADPREMYVKCLHAWNAWRKGEPTVLQYRASAPLPAAK